MDAAIVQLLTYCQADTVFFELPARMADHGSLFAVTRRRLPPGWRPVENDLWVELHPPGLVLPEQGWKIHVSATLDSAETVCDIVVDFCIEHGLAVKYLRSKAAMRLLNGKYADRASSGKLLTIYPVDENQLAQVLPELARRLQGFTGPYILSDLRYEDSTVYVRYGAFRRMTYVEPQGDVVHAIHTPDGRLVPDRREPIFNIPEWVSVPDVLRASLDQRNAGGSNGFPYQIERALHFSNGGGVYLARQKNSGPYVVLLEARPHAGLDRDGADAVARLVRQRDYLKRLNGLDCVPRVLDHFVFWEHHFLVEEYIEGTTLLDEVLSRYPLVHPNPADESIAEYTQWAIELLAAVDHALMAVHARGVRFTDLHPANIIVRPDGSVALVDFELAADLSDPRSPGLAAPGFGVPPGLSGRAADNYVLNCLRQWMFLPISPLTDRDPVKLVSLTEVIEEHFPVPKAFKPRMIRQFRAGWPTLDADAAAELFRAEPLHWPTIRDSLVGGIQASATLDRPDRLFPGDPQQYMSGGFTLAHGAAGVLWALHQAGAPVPAEQVDWLVAAAGRHPDPRPGLLEGLHGVAVTLHALGWHDEALDMLERARKLHDGLVTPGIHSGLAGAGLTLLHFGDIMADDELVDEAIGFGQRLAGQLDDASSPMFSADSRVGLQYGLTGVAYFFLRLHDSTGEQRYLDLARQALRREIGRGERLADGTFQLLEANRYHAYLGTGSIGLALVLAQYLSRRERVNSGQPDDLDCRSIIDQARKACRSVFIRHPFLFMGRAGTIAALRLLGFPQDVSVVNDHIHRLSWHAVSYAGYVAFPGNQLLRLSMDLATGTAGVLVALAVAFGQTASLLPVLDLQCTWSRDPEGNEWQEGGDQNHGMRAQPAGAEAGHGDSSPVLQPRDVVRGNLL